MPFPGKPYPKNGRSGKELSAAGSARNERHDANWSLEAVQLVLFVNVEASLV
jgi:hypothetical protein